MPTIRPFLKNEKKRVNFKETMKLSLGVSTADSNRDRDVGF